LLFAGLEGHIRTKDVERLLRETRRFQVRIEFFIYILLISLISYFRFSFRVPTSSHFAHSQLTTTPLWTSVVFLDKHSKVLGNYQAGTIAAMIGLSGGMPCDSHIHFSFHHYLFSSCFCFCFCRRCLGRLYRRYSTWLTP
jgi:hypothetical protein